MIKIIDTHINIPFSKFDYTIIKNYISLMNTKGFVKEEGIFYFDNKISIKNNIDNV